MLSPDLLIDHEEESTDLMRHRKLILKNNVIHFKQDDQYGLWTINFDKGQVPQKLTGKYTDILNALTAIENYLNEKNRLDEIISA